jgi:hypothetical protein
VRTARRSRRASNLLLVVGYALAAGAGVKLVPAWRERRGNRILVFEAGTACVTAGLSLRRKWILAAANGLTLAGVAAAWVVTGRRRP